MKINARLIVAGAVALASLARLFIAAQASNMPTEPSRRADVLPFKGKERRKP